VYIYVNMYTTKVYVNAIYIYIHYIHMYQYRDREIKHTVNCPWAKGSSKTAILWKIPSIWRIKTQDLSGLIRTYELINFELIDPSSWLSLGYPVVRSGSKAAWNVRKRSITLEYWKQSRVWTIFGPPYFGSPRLTTIWRHYNSPKWFLDIVG